MSRRYTEDHPFAGDQYVVMGLTTKTWHKARLPLEALVIQFDRDPVPDTKPAEKATPVADGAVGAPASSDR